MVKNSLIKKSVLCLTLAGLAAPTANCMYWPTEQNSSVFKGAIGGFVALMAFAILNSVKRNIVADTGDAVSDMVKKPFKMVGNLIKPGMFENKDVKKGIKPKKIEVSFDKDFAPGTIHPDIESFRERIKINAAFNEFGLTPSEVGINASSLGLSNIELQNAEKELRIPRSILLYGPTSTGKTFTALALANELGAKECIEISGSDLRLKYEGDSPIKVHLLFETAKHKSTKNQPCVIIINEIDGGTSGTQNKNSSGLSKDIANTFQTIMDRKEFKDIYLIATTNRIKDEHIPAPIKSRFAKRLEIPQINNAQRASVIRFYAKKHNLTQVNDEQWFKELFEKTKNYNMRDLVYLMEELSTTVREKHSVAALESAIKKWESSSLWQKYKKRIQAKVSRAKNKCTKGTKWVYKKVTSATKTFVNFINIFKQPDVEGLKIRLAQIKKQKSNSKNINKNLLNKVKEKKKNLSIDNLKPNKNIEKTKTRTRSRRRSFISEKQLKLMKEKYKYI